MLVFVVVRTTVEHQLAVRSRHRKHGVMKIYGVVALPSGEVEDRCCEDAGDRLEDALPLVCSWTTGLRPVC